MSAQLHYLRDTQRLQLRRMERELAPIIQDLKQRGDYTVALIIELLLQTIEKLIGRVEP